LRGRPPPHGSTADNYQPDLLSPPDYHCGDFAGFVIDEYAGTGLGWNADLTLLQTTFMIFYR